MRSTSANLTSSITTWVIGIVPSKLTTFPTSVLTIEAAWSATAAVGNCAREYNGGAGLADVYVFAGQNPGKSGTQGFQVNRWLLDLQLEGPDLLLLVPQQKRDPAGLDSMNQHLIGRDDDCRRDVLIRNRHPLENVGGVHDQRSAGEDAQRFLGAGSRKRDLRILGSGRPR